jgi:hypothetical protein
MLLAESTRLLSLSDQLHVLLLEQSGALVVGIVKLLDVRLSSLLPKKARSALHTIRFSNCARRQSIMQALISFQMK